MTDIDGLFNTLRNGTDGEKSQVLEFIRRHENLHLLSTPAFVRAAVSNADLFGIPGMTPEEVDAYSCAALDAEETCPCCGQTIRDASDD